MINQGKTVRYPLLFLSILFSILISGCDQNYGGDVGGASVNNQLDFGKFNAEGARLYGQMCEGCHGVEGNGTEIGTPLVACATCTDIGSLAEEISLTMPIGKNTSASDCTGSCASDIAEYIMFAFNGLALYEATTSLKGVASNPLDQTLRNATVQLAGRLPTDAEITQVTTQGEAGFSAVMDTVLDEPEFYRRLTEMFNDVFLTDKYIFLNDTDGAIEQLDNDDFPQLRWYDTVYASDGNDATDDNRNCSRRINNDAIAREGLELINYLAKNNMPITGLVDADYTMVNWYSQQAYEAELINPQESFKVLAAEDNPCLVYSSSYSNATVRHDPYDFKPARITAVEHDANGIPHAGILTSTMFLARFPTTNTNLNRHRSYTVYDLFLDTNILDIEGSRPEDAIDVSSTNPTLDNPACYTCHTVMDPVAAAFQHWDEGGRRIPSNSNTDSSNRWPSGIESPGIAGKTLPVTTGSEQSEFSSMLQWLGRQIAADPRYMRAITRHLYKGLIGQDLLPTPGNNASEAEVTAFNAQRGILSTIGQAMRSNNWNVKTAIKGILLSPYYRAKSIDSTLEGQADHIGSTRLLTPEMLQRKITALFGFGWYQLEPNDKDNRIMFGGIDSDSVIERIESPNGLMVAMQERMAVEMACRGTAFDFTKERSPQNNQRRLFKHVSLDTVPLDGDGFELASNIEAIKTNIQYLHNILLSEQLPLDDPEIQATYQVFLDTWTLGNTLLANSADYDPTPSSSLEWTCRGRWDRENNDTDLAASDRVEQDSNYTIRAWMAVITYLLSDYRFIFE